MDRRNQWTPEDVEKLRLALSGLVLLVDPMLRIASAIARTLTPLAELGKRVGKTLWPVIEVFVEIAKRANECEKLDKAGWLPHLTSPFELLSENPHWTTEEVRERVNDYYDVYWSVVSQALSAAALKTSVDEEAKATFIDALRAHEAGIFRATPRLLFPELERLAREILHKGEKHPKSIASQKKLREIAETLSYSVESFGLHTMRFYRRLEQHLYEHVREEAQITRYAADPVPNRHAVIHGYVSYSSAQSSINALIIALYVYQLLSVYLNMDEDELRLLENSANQLKLPNVIIRG